MSPWPLRGGEGALGEAQGTEVTLLSENMKLLSGEALLYLFRFSKFL